MKNIFLLIALTLGITSCSSDETYRIDNSDLVGVWSWISTDGGIGGNIHETPESTEKTVQLKLNSASGFSIFENEIEVSSGTYELSIRESIHSGELERYITYSTDTPSQYIVLGGLIEVHDGNQLNVSDNTHDGIGSVFEKIN